MICPAPGFARIAPLISSYAFPWPRGKPQIASDSPGQPKTIQMFWGIHKLGLLPKNAGALVSFFALFWCHGFQQRWISTLNRCLPTNTMATKMSKINSCPVVDWDLNSTQVQHVPSWTICSSEFSHVWNTSVLNQVLETKVIWGKKSHRRNNFIT